MASPQPARGRSSDNLQPRHQHQFRRPLSRTQYGSPGPEDNPSPTPASVDLGELIEEESSDEDKEDEDKEGIVDQERVTIISTHEEFNKIQLAELLSKRFNKACIWKHGQHIFVPFSAELFASKPAGVSAPGTLQDPLLGVSAQPPALDRSLSCSIDGKCLIFFYYGIVVMWGLTDREQRDVIEHIVNAAGVRPLDSFVEKDKYRVQYSSSTQASITNDILMMPLCVRRNVSTRIAVGYAFAQSTKLGVFEEQGLDLLRSTSHLPQELARKGYFSLSRKALSKMIGRLYVHKSDVNLVSSALDTPEYFWNKADSLQDLYKNVAKYLEIDERIESVKNRLEVIQELFDMLQSRHDAQHGSVLEWIVIVLVALEGLVGILEFCGTIGLIRPVEGAKTFTSRFVHHAFGGHDNEHM